MSLQEAPHYRGQQCPSLHSGKPQCLDFFSWLFLFLICWQELIANWIWPTGFTLPNPGIDRLIFVLAWGAGLGGVSIIFGLFVIYLIVLIF